MDEKIKNKCDVCDSTNQIVTYYYVDANDTIKEVHLCAMCWIASVKNE